LNFPVLKSCKGTGEKIGKKKIRKKERKKKEKEESRRSRQREIACLKWTQW